MSVTKHQGRNKVSQMVNAISRLDTLARMGYGVGKSREVLKEDPFDPSLDLSRAVNAWAALGDPKSLPVPCLGAKNCFHFEAFCRSGYCRNMLRGLQCLGAQSERCLLGDDSTRKSEECLDMKSLECIKCFDLCTPVPRSLMLQKNVKRPVGIFSPKQSP